MVVVGVVRRYEEQWDVESGCWDVQLWFMRLCGRSRCGEDVMGDARPRGDALFAFSLPSV